MDVNIGTSKRTRRSKKSNGQYDCGLCLKGFERQDVCEKSEPQQFTTRSLTTVEGTEGTYITLCRVQIVKERGRIVIEDVLRVLLANL